jgi:hypothetical protein
MSTLNPDWPSGRNADDMGMPPPQPDAASAEALHSPTPWEQFGPHIWSRSGKANVCSVSEPRAGKMVGYTPVDSCSDGIHEAYANAELIVEAVNELAPLRARLATLEAENAALKDKADLAQELRDKLAKLADACDGNYFELVKSAYALKARFDATGGRKT